MRGKLLYLIIQHAQARITPADAGKTSIGYGSSRVSEDHPRGCGENLKRGVPAERIEGSPPRMRGKPADKRTLDVFFGITPADAGKTFLKVSVGTFVKDHPRGCGEN